MWLDLRVLIMFRTTLQPYNDFFSIDNQDKTILLPTIVSNIINKTSSTLTTILTSPSWDYQQHPPVLHLQFTSFSSQLPPIILDDPVINVITVPPNIWRKKTTNKYKPLVYNDVNEDLYIFGKCFKPSYSWKIRLRSDIIY